MISLLLVLENDSQWLVIDYCGISITLKWNTILTLHAVSSITSNQASLARKYSNYYCASEVFDRVCVVSDLDTITNCSMIYPMNEQTLTRMTLLVIKCFYNGQYFCIHDLILYYY